MVLVLAELDRVVAEDIAHVAGDVRLRDLEARVVGIGETAECLDLGRSIDPTFGTRIGVKTSPRAPSMLPGSLGTRIG